MTTALLLVATVLALVAAAVAVRTLRAVERRLAAERGRRGAADTALAAMRTERDRLAAALDALGHTVVVADADGTVVHRAAGGDGGDHGALAQEVVARLLRAALAGREGREPLELFGPRRRSLVVTARPLRHEGTVVGAMATVDDVTEHRRLESMRSDFVANLTHELKTPIGAVGLLAETLADESDPEVIGRLAERMQAEAFRVSGIIDELLDLTRLEHDPDDAGTRAPVALDDLVDEAVSRVRAVTEHRAITVDVTCPPGTVVVGDRRQLLSAVHNLLENAVKYSEDGSAVDVRVECTATAVDLVVHDRGIGIPARDLDRVFERFYRVDRARARGTGGTGLGLSIVRHVATNHGGDVTVESVEGEGSTFRLHLPRGTLAEANRG